MAVQLVQVFEGDLKAAGIPRRDEPGRVLGGLALLTTFGRPLSKHGATPCTAQADMRHSSPALTASLDTDARLLGVHGALEVLPWLPLDTEPGPSAAPGRAPG